MVFELVRGMHKQHSPSSTVSLCHGSLTAGFTQLCYIDILSASQWLRLYGRDSIQMQCSTPPTDTIIAVSFSCMREGHTPTVDWEVLNDKPKLHWLGVAL